MLVIHPNQIIGDRRLGFKYIVDVLDYARPMVAAIGLGLAKRAFAVNFGIHAGTQTVRPAEFAIFPWPEKC